MSDEPEQGGLRSFWRLTAREAYVALLTVLVVAIAGVIYTNDDDPNNPVFIRVKAGGIGPFAGGYGFGARSTLLGYFLRVDAAWEMKGVFRAKPMWYFAMGFDF